MNSQQMGEIGTKLQQLGLSGRKIPEEMVEALEQMEVEIDAELGKSEPHFTEVTHTPMWTILDGVVRRDGVAQQVGDDGVSVIPVGAPIKSMWNIPDNATGDGGRSFFLNSE